MEKLHPELLLRATRSAGSGGQHVNKTSTRVELFFDIAGSRLLSQEEKDRLLEVLASRLSQEGVLRMVSQEERSQGRNKKRVLEKFDELIAAALEEETPRIPTEKSKEQDEARLEMKKRLSSKKAERQPKNWMGTE